MGTRHLIGVVVEGDYKVAQYGQWDGYIDGQGANVLKFLCSANMEQFREKLNNCRFIDERELREMYIQAGDKPDNNSGFVDWSVVQRFNKMYPSLSRDTGAEILNIIMNSDVEVPLCDNRDFIKDGLFCEYAYILNFDTMKLECYIGGENKFAEYQFDHLPTVEQMKKDCKAYGNR